MKSTLSLDFDADNRETRSAFTLVELLVVITIMSLLALVSVAGTNASEGQTKTALCASNIRQLLVASQKYASDNNEKLPQIAGATSWAWDLPEPVASALLKTGVEKKHFYCPGTSPRFTDEHNWAARASLWNFGVRAEQPKPTDFHMIGYVLAYWGPGSKLAETNQNSIILSEAPFGGGRVVPASERVLVADATLSVGMALPGYQHPENNYTNIYGGSMIPHLSAHLTGDLPVGGNLGFKDGHVAWRDFKEMVTRAGGGGTSFWW